MSVSSESLPHGPLNILIVSNILTVLTSVAVALTNFVLRKKARSPNSTNSIIWDKKIFLEKPFYLKAFLFSNITNWIRKSNVTYQWQKLIVKEIFVKFIFAIEDLKVNKIRRIFYFFCLSTISGKICRTYFCNWFLQSRKKGQI